MRVWDFCTWLKCSNPDTLLPNWQPPWQVIPEIYYETHSRMVNKLPSISHVILTKDGWSFRNSMKTSVLQTFPLYYNHTCQFGWYNDGGTESPNTLKIKDDVCHVATSICNTCCAEITRSCIFIGHFASIAIIVTLKIMEEVLTVAYLGYLPFWH